MSYKRLNMKNGDVINDYHINYLQDAISKISSEGKNFKERLAVTLTKKGIPSSKDETFDTLMSKIDSLPSSKEQEPETIWPDIRENIESGHIRLLVKTGDWTEFFIQATTAARFIVDWGDSTVNRYYVPAGGLWIKKNIAASAGNSVTGQSYKVAMIDISLDMQDGAISRFQAPSNSYKDNILWFCSKDIIFTTGLRMFNNNSNTACNNLKYIDVIGGSINGNLEYFARWCGSLERINATFNPGPNSVLCAFDGCTKLKEPPIINLNDVTIANYLFSGCATITEFNYYINNNGSFTETSYMFQGCTNLTRFVTEQKFDFSKVSNQNYCFNNCNSLVKAPTITFGNGSAAYFFGSCTALREVQHEFILNNVTSTDCFFYKCLSLVNGPSEFSAPNTTIINSLFDGCSSIKAVPQVLTFPKAVNAQYIFRNCYSLNRAPKTINLPAATDIKYMFQSCSTLTDPPTLINADVANTAHNVFESCTMLTKAPVTINLPLARNVAAFFYQCSSMITGPDKFYAPLANDANSFFISCNMMENAGRRIEIGNENPSGCNFKDFFKYCASLVNLPTEGDIHKGWGYEGFFNSTANITYESFQQFCGKGLSFPHATTMYMMFQDAKVRKISPITAPNCTNTSGIFYNNAILEEIGDLNFPTCTNMQNAFTTGASLIKLGKMSLDSLSNNNAGFSYLNKIKKLELENLRCGFTLNNASELTSVRLFNHHAEHAWHFEFQNCKMDAAALNRLLEDLPNRTGKTKYNINIKGNPGATTCNKDIGIDKNWNVITQ